ncbi:MAG: DUF4397 domain-containing protein, partial [Chitinophagaceae bacterium]|nr:DUF4397 domain-containing protein [Chitinophagaceae bacterium]
IIGMLLVVACSKNFDGRAPENTNLATSSYVRFFVGSLGATRNFISIDNQQLNGTALSMGGVFPGSGTITGFNLVSPGSRSISIVDSAATPAQTPLTVTQNFAAGQYYTVFTYDTSTAVKALVTNDVFTIPTDTTCNLRFVNIGFSSVAVPNLDVFSRARGAVVIANIPKLGVSPFVPHRTQSARYLVVDTLDIRETGTTNIVASVPTFTFNPQRTYTVVFRGRYQSTTGAMSRGAAIIATY